MMPNVELSVGYAASKAAENVGKAGLWLGKNSAKAGLATAAAVGTAAGAVGLYAGGKIAQGAINIAGSAFESLFSKGLNPIGGAIGTAGGIASHFVKYNPRHQVYSIARRKYVTRGGNFRLTKLGTGFLAVAELIGGGKQAYADNKVNKMGMVDTQKVTATPDFSPQQYTVQPPDMAGATGDLVFALHANR